MLNTSCHTLKIVVLLCSHHSCTLSIGLTFSNTISLHFILGFSSFNLHHFILGVACSDVQRFLPYVLLLMCFTIKCRTQLLIHMLPKRLFFIRYTTPCGAQAHMTLTTISSNASSIVITGSLFLLTLIRYSFSSLDSTIPTPFHSCSFVQLLSNLHPPQLQLVSYTHNTPTFLVSIISAKLPSSSRHRPNIQSAHSHALTVQIPHKNDIYGD